MIYRKATFNDIESIFNLVNDYASDGIMLARSRNTLFETLRDMVVAVDEETKEVVGVGGLHVVWDRMAEVRTMAISPAHTRRGIGAEIVKRLLEEGRALGVTMFFTLTYKPGFFQTLGFHTVTKETLPPKVWKDCIDCPKFPNCDEIALIRDEGGAAGQDIAFHP
ncbi:N-acetyltransferase [uncultured Selenomonas sp.]|uniref:N-acetyltransferase n=1 Tax=uncultured Selenomonas sp. TaxID=159275 RepID=UPI0025EA9803|nr:N-acetyltransferase [uncultured Selenomonas sp.]